MVSFPHPCRIYIYVPRLSDQLEAGESFKPKYLVISLFRTPDMVVLETYKYVNFFTKRFKDLQVLPGKLNISYFSSAYLMTCFICVLPQHLRIRVLISSDCSRSKLKCLFRLLERWKITLTLAINFLAYDANSLPPGSKFWSHSYSPGGRGGKPCSLKRFSLILCQKEIACCYTVQLQEEWKGAFYFYAYCFSKINFYMCA